MRIIKFEMTPEMKNECVNYYVKKLEEPSKFDREWLELDLKILKDYLSPLDETTEFNNIDDFSKLVELQCLITIPYIRKALRKLYLYTRNHLIQIPDGFKFKLSKYEQLLFDVSKNCHHLVFERITNNFEYVYIEPTIKDCERILNELDKVIMYDYEISSKVIVFRKDVYKIMKRLTREYIKDNK